MALRGLLYLLLALFVAYYMLPLFVMAITSLKSLDEIRAGSLMSLPDSVSLASWATAWSSACAGIQCEGLQPFFWNSVKMVVPAVILSTFLGAVNGYALSHWRFRGANVIFALMLFGCFIPFQVVLLPMDALPGDGPRSLHGALSRELAAEGVPLAETIGDDDLLVFGDVELGPDRAGSQAIRIVWYVIRAADNPYGWVWGNQVPQPPLRDEGLDVDPGRETGPVTPR